ncbi:hypothetical protein D3C86_1412550 [compost metagenome]
MIRNDYHADGILSQRSVTARAPVPPAGMKEHGRFAFVFAHAVPQSIIAFSFPFVAVAAEYFFLDRIT